MIELVSEDTPRRRRVALVVLDLVLTVALCARPRFMRQATLPGSGASL